MHGPVDELRVAHRDIQVHAQRQLGGEERADTREGHLPKREQARPSGEHRQGRGADGVGQDGRIEEVLRRLRDHQWQDDCSEDHRAAMPDPVEVAHPRQCADVVWLRGWLEASWHRRHRIARATSALHPHGDEDSDEEKEVGEPGLVQEVELNERLGDADGDTRYHGPREMRRARR